MSGVGKGPVAIVVAQQPTATTSSRWFSSVNDFVFGDQTASTAPSSDRKRKMINNNNNSCTSSTTTTANHHQHQQPQRKKSSSTIMNKYREELAILDTITVELDKEGNDNAYFAAYF